MITSLDKNTALVLIDMQNGIVSLPLFSSAEPVIANCVALATAFRKAGQPVVIVNVDPATNPLNKLRKDAQQHSGELPAGWLDIIPQLEVQEGDIRITKNNWNAFTNPDLHRQLQSKNVTGIVLAGIATSVGVEGTARAAVEHAYNITFVTDAMSDMVEDAHNNSLKNIFPRIGELGTTAEVIAKL